MKKVILILFFVIVLGAAGLMFLNWSKIDKPSDKSAETVAETNSKDESKTEKVNIGKAVEKSDRGSLNLDDIYNPDLYRNKEFKYNPDLKSIPDDSPAVRVSRGDLNRIYDHYAAEYLAKKYGIKYTLQDIIDWVKVKQDVEEPKDANSLLEGTWATIQLVGWKEVALDNELPYVQEKAEEKIMKKGIKSITDDEVKEAMNIYADNLRKNGYTNEDEVKKKSISLYLSSKEGISEEYVEDAYTYAELKVLKEYLPEKYNEMIKHSENIKDTMGEKLSPEGDV